MQWLKQLFGRRTLREFEERFPGKCAVCSNHEYGLRNCYTTAPVDAHQCPEDYARWNEAGTPMKDKFSSPNAALIQQIEDEHRGRR